MRPRSRPEEGPCTRRPEAPPPRPRQGERSRRLSLLLGLLPGACGVVEPWNNPYPVEQAHQTIYYASFSERPKHLDPAVAYSANEYVFIGQIYEPPLQYHFLKRPYQLAPLTARTLPLAEPLGAEGRVRYRIHIRSDVRYQPHPALARNASGQLLYHPLSPEDLRGIHRLQDFPEQGSRPLTAADYIYQIKRLVHPDVHSPLAGLMSRYILGMDALADELREARSRSPDGAWLDLRAYSLAGVQYVDEHRYDIILRERYPQFIYWLAMPFFAPMPWEADRFYAQPGLAARNITLDWYPIGTGPFMLTENNPNRRMVMQRNPHFRGEPYPRQGQPDDPASLLADAGRPMPFIDQAIFSLEREAIPRWNKFLQGYYDSSGITSDSFDQAVQFTTSGEAQLTALMRARGISLVQAVNPSIFYLGFNMIDETVGGDSARARLLRRAIAIAVDYEEYIAIFANGRGIAAQGPLPPGIFGYREGQAGSNPYVYRWQRGRAVRRSIDEARILLREAGYPGGRDQDSGQALVLYLDTPAAGPGARASLDWLRKQFARIGINLQVRVTDYNRFQDKMRTGSAQLYQWGWNADYPDPENFFFLLYGLNAEVVNQGKNVSNYVNPEFDALFERMATMPDGSGRQAIIDQMMAILQRDGPWLWGFHPISYTLHHGWYHNTRPNLMANNTLKYKRIDPLQRQSLRRAWNQPVRTALGLLLLLVGVAALAVWYTWRQRQQACPRRVQSPAAH